jgi:protein gp37
VSSTTTIQWCDATVNFWEGCTKVSPGCAHCYAAARNVRFSRGENWGPGAPRRIINSAQATLVALQRRAVKEERRLRVFPNSLSDWLDPEVHASELAVMLDLMRRNEALDFLTLTKRPQLWRQRLQAAHDAVYYFHGALGAWISDWLDGTPPKNVWVGTTVEDQVRAEERREALRAIPAAIRFASYEPALAPVNWSGWEFINWLIMGGESGSGARPLDVEWLWETLFWCRGAGVAPFVKQLGARIHAQNVNAMDWPEETEFREAGAGAASARVIVADHGDSACFPAELQVREFPKAA